MSRLNPAAIQLITQVSNIDRKASAKAVDPGDGFGVHRSIEFDAKTSKWLFPALELIDDPRIDSLDYEGKGRGVVHFVGDARADHRYPEYELEKVLAVLNGES